MNVSGRMFGIARKYSIRRLALSTKSKEVGLYAGSDLDNNMFQRLAGRYVSR